MDLPEGAVGMGINDSGAEGDDRMKTFHLQRDADETGISGTGKVAEGVQFTDGTCAMRWLSASTSTAIYADIGVVETIHGHNGMTQIVFGKEPSQRHER